MRIKFTRYKRGRMTLKGCLNGFHLHWKPFRHARKDDLYNKSCFVLGRFPDCFAFWSLLTICHKTLMLFSDKLRAIDIKPFQRCPFILFFYTHYTVICISIHHKHSANITYCHYYQESEDGKTYFVKIHAPWEVLATYADVLKIKVPFKVNDIPDNSEIPMNWLSTPFRLPGHIMNPEPDYFTAPFNKSKSDFFLIEDKETFFPPSTRNRIVSTLILFVTLKL